MTSKPIQFDGNKLNELSELLKEGLCIYRQDREIALRNYNDLKSQLSKILEGDFEMSEEAKLEAECNKALKLVMDASKRYDEVVRRVTEIISKQLENESREKISKNLGGLIPRHPVDFRNLPRHNSGEIEMDDDEMDPRD